mmetsp:Transcript_19439/g.22228  ORF Transcript_19439/g.22228 Transcript_19439/m.22228 type:complete len:109 (+) Transcript_19439:188-514(+)
MSQVDEKRRELLIFISVIQCVCCLQKKERKNFYWFYYNSDDDEEVSFSTMARRTDTRSSSTSGVPVCSGYAYLGSPFLSKMIIPPVLSPSPTRLPSIFFSFIRTPKSL